MLQLPDDLFDPIERSYLWPSDEIIHHLGIQLYLEDYREDTHRRRTPEFVLAKTTAFKIIIEERHLASGDAGPAV